MSRSRGEALWLEVRVKALRQEAGVRNHSLPLEPQTNIPFANPEGGLASVSLDKISHLE